MSRELHLVLAAISLVLAACQDPATTAASSNQGTAGSASAATVAEAERPSSGQVLTGDQLRELYRVPRTVKGTTGRADYTAVRQPDGTQTITWNSGGNSGSSRGTWRIDGDRICSTWDELRGGAEQCLAVSQTGPNQYVALDDDGSVSSRFAID